MTTLRTISDRRAADLARSRERCLNLISTLAHEMSQPLAVLHCTTELALLGQHSPVEYRDILQESLIELSRLHRLLRIFRELGEVERRIGKLESVALLPLVREAVETAAPVADSKGVAIHIESTQSEEAFAKPDHLRQALHLIITRAVERSPRKGAVVVSITPSSELTSLIVTDQGPAVSPRQLTGLLSVHLATTAGLDGSGYEWAYARSVVEATGGTFTMQSGANGGCSVHLGLPHRFEKHV